MVSELEDLYEGLERKVNERTTELQHQKEIVEEKQKEIIDIFVAYAAHIHFIYFCCRPVCAFK